MVFVTKKGVGTTVEAGELNITCIDSNGKLKALTSANVADLDGSDLTGITTDLKVLNKTSQQSNNTTTAADISDLTISLAANEILHFHAYLIVYSATSTTGIETGINGPASPTYVSATIIGWSDATTIDTTKVTNYEEFQTSGSSVTGSQPRVFEIYGVVENGGNAGTFALRLRSEIATSAVYCKKGSWILYFIT